MGKIIIFIGLILIIIGLIVHFGFKIPLGRLPGDIVIERENFTIYLPIASCIVVSIFLTLVFYLYNKFSG